ncbi:MAG: response regulator [Pseudomonadota bacterium]
MHRILLVDDSEALTKAYALRLRHAGYDVTTACDIEEGFTRALECQPAVAILDINLPSGSGLDLARRLHTQIPLSIIFATANRDASLSDQAKHLGAIALLTKPFDATQLLRTIDRALAATSVH